MTRTQRNEDEDVHEQPAPEPARRCGWGGLMAAAALITVPVVLAALLGRKYLVAGLTSGASKG
ncbi:hypothetical protein GCM10010221_43310 [Streptomyces parvus]|nr:hypothetical protein GCM10010221_43310 [Streptomyces parvus]